MQSPTNPSRGFAAKLLTALTAMLPAASEPTAMIAGGLVAPIAPELRPADVASECAPIPGTTARLAIYPVGGGYYNVVVSGHSTAINAAVGARVYGEDTWFDDFLFSIIGIARTDQLGNFSISRTVFRSVLNEDWEGRDEIYAIADVTGGGSGRTNTIAQSF
ncbi:MAG: hypothetical protein IPM29_20325 [Planctomycetes bacterium]|nr:hypothetical protein [Planctomycetota bacterium]